MSFPVSTVQLSARGVTRFLSITAAGFCVAYGGVVLMRHYLRHPDFLGINRLFDLDQEANLPTLFSTALFFLDASWLFLLAKLARPQDHKRTWYFLSALFIFLGVDEFASIHELFIGIVHRWKPTTGLLYFAWIIPYGVGVLGLATLLLRWFLSLDRTTQIRFGGAAILFVSGAIGMEMLGGRHWELTKGVRDLTYDSMVAAEESLEMSGLLLFGYGLLSLLERYSGVEISLQIVPPAGLRIHSGHPPHSDRETQTHPSGSAAAE